MELPVLFPTTIRRGIIATWVCSNAPSTPYRGARTTEFATLDETARLRQQKIAEWTARNLANQARIKEAETEAKVEAAASYTDAYCAARFPDLAELEFYNHDDDHTFILVNTLPPPATKKDRIKNNQTINIQSPHPPDPPTQPLPFPTSMHIFNSIPINQTAPKNDCIAQRLAFYNSNREGALAHQRMVNGESTMDLDDSDEEF